jgi:penicillin-binding protein 2
VYFFHHAADLGAVSLVDWATRFGFGRATGVDGIDESAGRLPDPTHERHMSQTQLLAIGQGPLTATPLQVVRMYAAIANGGRLVTPQLVKQVGGGGPEAGGGGSVSSSLQPPASGLPIPGLAPTSLAAVREGLRRAVENPNGTAYHSVRMPWPQVAGKTGTAETGGEQADHAWFAGYVPADEPRFAFVVVLEHGGSGATVAGSIARDLVLRMRQLGYFGSQPIAERPIPPGKG